MKTMLVFVAIATGLLSSTINAKEPSAQQPGVSSQSIFSNQFKLEAPSSVPLAKLLAWHRKFQVINATKQPSWPRYAFIPRKDDAKDYAVALKWYLKEAAHGYTNSQFKIGQMYEKGLGVPKNYEEAYQWYLKAAEHENPKAQYALGLFYLNGKGVEKNYKQALHWLNASAELGSAKAQYVLGVIYLNGLGLKGSGNYIPKRTSKAAELLKKAAEKEIVEAQYQLALLIDQGLIKAKPDEAKRLYQYAAVQGHAGAQMALMTYYLSNNDQMNVEKSLKQVLKAAKNGDANSQFLLALMFDRGVVVEKKPQKAMVWYRKAAEGQHPVAQYILGFYLLKGLHGLPSNPTKAYYWTKSAATKGVVPAQFNLALLLHQKYFKDVNADPVYWIQQMQKKGHAKSQVLLADIYVIQGSDQESLKKAAKIVKKLAVEGNASAQLRYAFMLEKGIYFKKNYARAFKWYKKAAEKNNRVAQYVLGTLYEKGRGVKQSAQKADYWYKKAEDENPS